MKKYIIILALAFSFSGATAQTIRLGDANGDGNIDATDLATTVDIILGSREALTVTVGGAEAFIRENTLTGTYLVSGIQKRYYNGYEYVDLGLPSGTLWCATNLGAFIPSEEGASYDQASATLPDGWTLPATTQVQELTSNCDITLEGSCLKIAIKADASKYILVPSTTPKLWTSEGTAIDLSSSDSTSLVYIRPVVTGSVPSTDSGNSNEIGQGEDNGELEAKTNTFLEE